MSQATLGSSPYQNSNLFSGYYLDERVADLDAWDCDEIGDGATLPGVDDETLAEIVVELYATADVSYRDLADVVPYSREWVGRRVRERRADAGGEKVEL